MTAAEHAAEAERMLAEIHEHMAKRGRKIGTEQANQATIAGVHATLALYYQAEPAR